MQRSRDPNSISSWFFIILCGIFALVYSYCLNVKYNNMEQKIYECTLEIQAPINNVKTYDGNEDDPETDYEVFFTYSVNGKEYSKTDRGTSTYKVGDTYHIFCNPDDPDEWITWTDVNYQDNAMRDILEFKTMGIGCIAVGIVIILFKALRRKRNYGDHNKP
jgi:hypothetical protein